MAEPSVNHEPRKPGRALVTGASTGIGAAFAERLARDGYDLLIVARNQSRLEELATRLREANGVEVEVVPADLTESTAVTGIIERIRSDGRLELVVNNAGFGTKGKFHELDPAREDEQVRLNVLALHRLSGAALPRMVERDRGGVINVASLAGLLPSPYFATYAATKSFVIAFTEALAEELADTNVRVQVLCPGFTRTEFQERAGVDANAIPSVAWMMPDAVVDASLASLRKGEVVCIPGVGNKAFTAVSNLLPRTVVRRISGMATKRFGDS